MKLALILSILILCGCGDRTRLNPGAQYGWYSASTAWMQRHATNCNAFYETSTGGITVWDQLTGMDLVGAALEEVAHAHDHQKPTTLWELIRKYQTPQRPGFLAFGHTPEDLAEHIALAASLPPPGYVQIRMIPPDPQAEPSR